MEVKPDKAPPPSIPVPVSGLNSDIHNIMLEKDFKDIDDNQRAPREEKKY